MAQDPRYIPAFTIEEVILDKDTGAPLTGGIVTFEQANQPGILKSVWQITNTSGEYTYTQLPNPMILSAIGTFQDALDNPVVPYFLPYDGDDKPEYYRVIVESAENVPQFVRDPVPYFDAEADGVVSSAYSNELSNTQFTEVLFDTTSDSYTYTFNNVANQVVELAPGWDLIVTSPAVGSVTVSQVTPVGSLNIVTNPATLLQINSSGLTNLELRQRIYGSPNLWGSGYLSASFVGKTYGGTDAVVTLNYSQSDGSVVDQPVVEATFPGNGNHKPFSGSAYIPVSSSNESFPDAYVDITLQIPLSVRIDLTSIMLVYSGDVAVSELVYDQETSDRQVDHLFHYYKPQLEFKPIPSMLVGWDFPLNPAQEGSTMTMQSESVNPKYIWDQTIGASLLSNVAVERNAVTGGFQATTSSNNDAFYLMQYLSGAEAKEIIGNRLSCNVNAWRTQAGGDVVCKVFMYRAPSTSVFPTLPLSIGSVLANGTFDLLSLGWTVIARGNLGVASGTLPVVNTANYSTINQAEDLKFNGWQVTDSSQIANTDKFAIVVTFSCPVTGSVVVVNSISLNKGDIPTRPAPQTANQVLRECQYYYEKSYTPNVVPGTPSNFASTQSRTMGISGQGAVNANVFAKSFELIYKSIKRSNAPIITFYSPETGVAAQVWTVIFYAGSQQAASNVTASNWLLTGNGAYGGTFTGQNVSSILSYASSGLPYTYALDGIIYFHYTANARIGVV